MMRIVVVLFLSAGICGFAGSLQAQETPPKDNCSNCNNIQVPETASKYLELAEPDKKGCESCNNSEIPSDALKRLELAEPDGKGCDTCSAPSDGKLHNDHLEQRADPSPPKGDDCSFCNNFEIPAEATKQLELADGDDCGACSAPKDGKLRNEHLEQRADASTSISYDCGTCDSFEAGKTKQLELAEPDKKGCDNCNNFEIPAGAVQQLELAGPVGDDCSSCGAPNDGKLRNERLERRADPRPPKGDDCGNCNNFEIPGEATRQLELAEPDKKCETCNNFDVPAEATKQLELAEPEGKGCDSCGAPNDGKLRDEHLELRADPTPPKGDDCSNCNNFEIPAEATKQLELAGPGQDYCQNCGAPNDGKLRKEPLLRRADPSPQKDCGTCG